jgi:hypothetical protein
MAQQATNRYLLKSALQPTESAWKRSPRVNGQVSRGHGQPRVRNQRADVPARQAKRRPDRPLKIGLVISRKVDQATGDHDDAERERGERRPLGVERESDGLATRLISSKPNLRPDPTPPPGFLSRTFCYAGCERG